MSGGKTFTSKDWAKTFAGGSFGFTQAYSKKKIEHAQEAGALAETPVAARSATELDQPARRRDGTSQLENLRLKLRQ